MAGKHVEVHIVTFDGEFDISINPKDKGKVLYQKVFDKLSIRESCYFGLQYEDKLGFQDWLKYDKKISDLKLPKDKPLAFRFMVKCFPMPEDFMSNETLRHLYLQLKQSILKDALVCSSEQAVLLASYTAQVDYGDFKRRTHTEGYLSKDVLLPRSVFTTHRLSRSEWEQRVADYHYKHRGLSREMAMFEYVKVCQSIDTYGIAYFNIRNKKAMELLLGVVPTGINIYGTEDKFAPKLSFAWTEILKVNYKDSACTLTPCDKKAPTFLFFCKKPKESKRIFELVSGYHDVHTEREKQDPQEVLRVKQQRERKTNTIKSESVEKEDIDETFNSKLALAEKEAEQRLDLLRQASKKSEEELAPQKTKEDDIFTKEEVNDQPQEKKEDKDDDINVSNMEMLKIEDPEEEPEPASVCEEATSTDEGIDLVDEKNIEAEEENRLDDSTAKKFHAKRPVKERSVSAKVDAFMEM